MKKLAGVLLFFIYLAVPSSVSAAAVSKMGIHILATEELTEAKDLMQVGGNEDEWHYVTIPFTLEDLEHPQRWENFFRDAKNQKIIPIIRLATKVENGQWVTPNRKNVVDQLNMLSGYEWPTDKKLIIIFNEVNHAKEWGGSIEPEIYARTFRFASNWAHAIDKKFVVLPAAMDLAAPNGSSTMEAFTYLNRMYAFDENIFAYADAWNSHSYPNPGFSSAPDRQAKNALNGFEYELSYLDDKSDKKYEVFITETGWEDNSNISYWLPSYYTYAMQHVWSHPQVVAVTPFILKGAPGPFTGFSFLSPSGKPTSQYNAFRSAMEKLQVDNEILLSSTN